METRRRVKTRKLDPGWRPGRSRRRQELAATLIQKRFRCFLLRRAFRESRTDARSSFEALRAFHRARDRKHWREVDLRAMSREELRLAALSLNVPSTGKKALLICRLQRWVDQHVLASDAAADAAARAQELYAKGQGAVFFCDAMVDATPIDVAPLRGKRISAVVAGHESDAVYAVDRDAGTLWLCKTGGLAAQLGLCSDALAKDSAAFEPPALSRWLVRPTFVHSLRAQHVVDARVAKAHGVARTRDGELFAWGDNAHGELGFPAVSADGVARNRPTLVATIANYPAVAMAVGARHTIAACDRVAGHDGVVFGWGGNTSGQIGVGTKPGSAYESESFPRPCVVHQVSALRSLRVTNVACGAAHSLALTDAGHVFAWGANDGGRLGLGAAKAGVAVCTPWRVRGVLDTLVVLEIACGAWHSACVAAAPAGVGREREGRVFTWGTGVFGQLGCGPIRVLHEPRAVRLPANTVLDEVLVKAVACGMHHTAALTTRDRVFAWGSPRVFSGVPRELRLPDSRSFGRIASIACGRSFTIFNTEQRTGLSFEPSEVARLWTVKAVSIPRLNLSMLPPAPLSSSKPAVLPLRLEPAADRKQREAEEQREAARVDDIDIETLVHPLCRVCWRCDGFQPSPLRLWVCRHCCHDKQLHGVRNPGAPLGEYEAARKLQTLYRARQARQMLQRARDEHYQRVFSIKHDAFFYYDLWRNRSTWERPAAVTPGLEIPIRDPDDEPRIPPPLTRDEAALVLQAHRRGFNVRRRVRQQLAIMFEKHIDLESHRVFYLQLRDTHGRPTLTSNVRLWQEPVLFRRLYSLGEPVEIVRLRRRANWSPDDAARVIQQYFRSFQARQLVQKIARSRFRKLLDEASGCIFYYNVITKESSWIKPKLLREQDGSAAVRRRTRLRPTKFADESAAATTIQAMYRRFVARKQLWELISRRYSKLVDPSTGQKYYYDRVAGASTWIKPAILGDFDLEVEGEAVPTASTPATRRASSARKSIVVAPRPRSATIAAARRSTRVMKPPAVASNEQANLPPRQNREVSLRPTMPQVGERARRKRHKRRLQRLRQMTRDEAASLLQRQWRANRARCELRSLLMEAYEQIWDPVSEHVYYYNARTGHVRWEKPVLLADQELAKQRRRIKRRRAKTVTDRGEASQIVARFMRCTHARAKLVAELQKRVHKVWDPDSHRYYYFDSRTGQSSWKKPVILRTLDLPVSKA